MIKRYKNKEKLKGHKKNSVDRIAIFYQKEKHYSKLLKECKNNPIIPSIINKPKKNNSAKRLKFKSYIPEDYKASLGESKIILYLIKNHINFRREVSFDLLPSLRFDFYLVKEKICIEFDGIQHYKYIDKFDKGDQAALHIRQSNDSRKNGFCKRNNLKLIRIPYYKINEIEKILNKELKINKYLP